MNSPSQEDLLGYLLGALDAREQEQVQQMVDRHPQLEERLLAIKATLAPLEQIDEPVGPPPGLARRCCQFVASSSRQLAQQAAAAAALNTDEFPADSAKFAGPANSTGQNSGIVQSRSRHIPEVSLHQLSPASLSAANLSPEPTERSRGSWSIGGGWGVMDLVFACTAAMLVAALLLPALSAARFNSRLVACQNNLRSVYHSLTQYAETHAGHFPEIPESGPLSTAGYVGPLLKSEGLLESDRLLACAGLVGSDSVVHIPSQEEILAAETTEELQSYRHRMLGHYGYSLGYLENGKYACPKNLGKSNYVLLADAPHNATPARISRNHGGWGQNCVMADGSIQFNRTGYIGTDAIYFNDRNVVAPGVGPADAVIAPAYVEPFPASACLQ